jgi:hypothetical protein
MESLRSSIENLTGMLSIGSLCILGTFMVLDGRTNIFQVLETYGKTATWAIVAAIPALVISYVVGVFAVTAAMLILRRIRWLYRPEDHTGLITVARFGNNVITNSYQELSRQRRLLEGAMIGFITIAIGAWSETANFPESRPIGLALIFGSLALALFCPFFSAILAKEERFLVAEVTRLSEYDGTQKVNESCCQEVSGAKDRQAKKSPEQ